MFSFRQRDIGFGRACRWALKALVAACRANVQIGFSWDDPKPLFQFYVRRLRGKSKGIPRATPESAPAVPGRGSAVPEID
jgi:hypothetical protein